MRIEIPGYKTMDLKYLILDYNGTIAKDGIIPESVKERLKKLSGIYEIYVLTADTHGTARKICEGLPLKKNHRATGWKTVYCSRKRTE